MLYRQQVFIVGTPSTNKAYSQKTNGVTFLSLPWISTTMVFRVLKEQTGRAMITAQGFAHASDRLWQMDRSDAKQPVNSVNGLEKKHMQLTWQHS